MVGFFGRGEDSQLGPAFNGKLWAFLCRHRATRLAVKEDGVADDQLKVIYLSSKVIISRALMAFITNAVMRDCIAFTVPFLLMQESDGIEFVKDALATAFLTNLDTTKVGTTFICRDKNDEDVKEDNNVRA